VKFLKQHLAEEHNLAPNAYRTKWGLESNYPTVARAYARRRSDLAKRLDLADERRRPGKNDTPEAAASIDRISLNALLLLLGGFSNDYGTPQLERWSAKEDARLIAYYRAHSLNGRLANGAMMELKLKFRNRTKGALYLRIYELRKSSRLEANQGPILAEALSAL
jgi:hypothetical protein